MYLLPQVEVFMWVPDVLVVFDQRRIRREMHLAWRMRMRTMILLRESMCEMR